MASAFSCSECDTSFTHPKNLVRHLAVHHHNSFVSCQHCDFLSTRADSLKRHVARYHNVNDKTVQPLSVQKPNSDSMSAEPLLTTKFDQRLKLPNNFIYSGSSQSGKTCLMMKTLENASEIYSPVPSRVYFIYSCKHSVFNSTTKAFLFLGFQESYNKLQEILAAQGINCDFINGSIVTEADLDSLADPNKGQTLIIIDDNSISAASSKEMAQVFTVARHKNCSIVLLLHFIFGPWPSSRIISANTAYYFLLKSPRMAKQVATLGSQLGKQGPLVAAYEREAKKCYGYVLVDLCTATPERHRIRTDIFNENHVPTMNVKPMLPEPIKAENVAVLPEPQPIVTTIDVKPIKKWIKWADNNQEKPKVVIKSKVVKKAKPVTKKKPTKNKAEDDNEDSEYNHYKRFGLRQSKGKLLLKRLMALK